MKEKPRILFMGANVMGHKCLQSILEAGHNIVGIFSIPQKFEISYAQEGVKNVLYHDFEPLAQEYNIPLRMIHRNISSSETLTYVKQLNPDLIIVVGWYYMVPKKIRECAPLGCIGFHNALLPKYRGGAPLNWALINGETEVGTSLFHFASGVDDGDIIAQRKIPVTYTDTIKTIYDSAIIHAQETLLDVLPQLYAGTAPRIQQDHSKASEFPQRAPKDGEIDWKWDSQRIYNFVRALTTPYPGAYTKVKGSKLTIYAAKETDKETEHSEGKIIHIEEESIWVSAPHNKVLQITEYTWESDVPLKIGDQCEFTQV